jgi:hypothetical protein
MTINTFDLKELIYEGQQYLNIEKELGPLLKKESITLDERLHYKNMINLRDKYNNIILKLCKNIIKENNDEMPKL